MQVVQSGKKYKSKFSVFFNYLNKDDAHKRKLHLWNIAPTNAFSVSCKGVCVRSSITTSSFSLTRARLPVPLPAFSRTVPSCAHDLKINHKKLKQYNQHAVLTHNSAFIIRVLTHSPLDLFFRFIGIRRYKKQQKKKTNTYNRHSSTYIVL